MKLAFGSVVPTERADDGAAPAADTILNARLLTALSSETTERGQAIEAILTQPVLSQEGRLILPEGTRVSGQVTVARPAASLFDDM